MEAHLHVCCRAQTQRPTLRPTCHAEEAHPCAHGRAAGGAGTLPERGGTPHWSVVVTAARCCVK